MDMIIGKEFTFDAAHKLEGEEYGICSNLHGHTYKLVIEIRGEMQKNGMVMNFKDLKEMVNKLVIKELDHTYLNDIENMDTPTVENIINWISSQLSGMIKVKRIILYETPTCYAILEN